MKVGNLELRTLPESTELSADIGGSRVYFRVPQGVPMEARGGPFLTLALPEAMGRGEPLEIDGSIPVSPVLLKHVSEIQEIYHSWNPELRRVAVECAPIDPPPSRPGVMSLYSGGIDSAYTFLTNREEITHLVFIEGFDHEVSSAEVAERAEHRRLFAETFGKAFIHVATNYREVARARRLDWYLVHGNCLAAVCLALGFERAFIPSSHSYAQLFPWGSHPVLDPLWGNGRTQVVHHGAGAGRTDKLRLVAECREVLDDLVVCWRYSQRNCGTCPKCLRTMATLYLLGVSTPAFPPLISMRQLRGLSARDRNECAFLDENIALARQVGARTIEKRLRAIHWRYEAQHLIEETDRLVFGRLLRSIYRKLVRPAWLDMNVTLGPKH